MSNRYYNHTNPFLPGTTAKSAEVNAQLDDIAAGLDTVQLEVDAKTQVGATLPLVDNTAAAAGTSPNAARADHVHPLPTLAALGAAPASHTQAISTITGLQTALDSKADATTTSNALATKADATATTNSLALKMDKSGGSLGATTMTGALTLQADGTALLHATTKQQMDAAVATRAPASHVHGASDLSSILAATTPAALASSAAVGVSTVAARADHAHPFPTAAQVGAAPTSHTHVVADVTGLQAALDAKATVTSVNGKLDKSGGTMTGVLTLYGAGVNDLDACTKKQMIDYVSAQTGGPFIPLVHTHAVGDVTDLSNQLAAKANVTDMNTKLSLSGGTMTGALTLSGAGTSANHAVTKSQMDSAIATAAPTAHTHTIANVTGLQAVLDGKADAGTTSSGLAARLPLSGGTLTGTLTWAGGGTQAGVNLYSFGHSGRESVWELGWGNGGWGFYCQKVANGTVQFGINGDTTINGGVYGLTTGVHQTFNGDGSYANQVNSRNGMNVLAGVVGNVFIPAAKVQSLAPGGWRLTSAFGHLRTGGNDWGHTQIFAQGDGGSTSAWSFTYPSGDFTAPGNVVAYSDARLKTDLVPIADALAKVGALTGYTYTRLDSGERQTGLIAQDVEKVLPEAVTRTPQQDGDGEVLGLAYGNMTGLLVEAIKTLAARVEALEAQLEGKA